LIHTKMCITKIHIVSLTDCPKDGEVIRGFQFFSTKMTHQSARMFCSERNASLVKNKENWKFKYIGSIIRTCTGKFCYAPLKTNKQVRQLGWKGPFWNEVKVKKWVALINLPLMLTILGASPGLLRRKFSTLLRILMFIGAVRDMYI
jgi:hypothetical protein